MRDVPVLCRGDAVTPPLESEVLAEVQLALGQVDGLRLARFNSGAIGTTFRRSSSVRGVPDLLGVLTVAGVGVAIGIECKVFGRDGCDCQRTERLYCRALSAEQRIFQRNMRASGAICFVAHSAENATVLLRYWCAVVADRIAGEVLTRRARS